MTTFRFALVVVLTLVLTASAFSQRKFGGKVVEVIDGKTAVVQMFNDSKLTVVLQFIEIPETDQPLNQVVREHLQNLILDKNVEVDPKGVQGNKTTGKILLNGIDIGQQMLRDGAAWYAVLEKSGQDSVESAAYLDQEALAKAEKRGVWSIENMKPAWEFRAAKAEAAKAAEDLKWEALQAENQARDVERANAKAKERERRQAAFRNRQSGFDPRGLDNFGTEMWANIRTAGMADANGLMINRFPEHNALLISTSTDFLQISNGKKEIRLECEAGYLSFDQPTQGTKEFAGLACKSESDKETFKNSNQLTITADGKKTNIGKTVRLGVQSDDKFNELLIFDLNRAALLKIAESGKVQLKIGEFSGPLPEKFHAMIKSLVLEISK